MRNPPPRSGSFISVGSLFNGILQLMIENDWSDHDFIEKNTSGLEAVADHVKQWTPKRTAEVTGVAEKSIRAAAELWGQAKTSFLTVPRVFVIAALAAWLPTFVGMLRSIVTVRRLPRLGADTAKGRSPKEAQKVRNR